MDNAQRQLYVDIEDLQVAHITLNSKYVSLIDNLKRANQFKVSGRSDMSKLFLAKSKLDVAKVTYDYHVLARDFAMWYQDYFVMKGI